MEHLSHFAGLFAFAGAGLMIIMAVFDRALSTTSVVTAWLLSIAGFSLGAYTISEAPMMLSGIMLAWSGTALAYGMSLKSKFKKELRQREGDGQKRLRDEQHEKEGGEFISQKASGGCVLSLISGVYTTADDDGAYDDFPFSWLFYLFSAAPSDPKLELEAWAVGAVYKVLYVRWGKVELKPVITLRCRKDTCKISASQTGKKAGQNSVVRAQVEYTMTPVGDKELEIDVVMGAAIESSGGPEFSVGKDGVAGLKLTWPDAKQSSTEEMGEYVWRCEAIETGGKTASSV